MHRRVAGTGSQRIIYWRLASADPKARPIEHVTIPPGAELKSSNECTPDTAVTVGENLRYDEGGPAVIVRAVDNWMCSVTMMKTGKQNNVIYWRWLRRARWLTIPIQPVIMAAERSRAS